MFTWLSNCIRERKKRAKGRKGKSREKIRKKEKKREKRGGREHGSKGERRRRVTAVKRRRGKAPRATTDSHELPLPLPTSVKPGKPPKPIFRIVFILNHTNSF